MDTQLLNIPTLPLRDVVVFPDMIFPLFVGRNKSVKALEKAIKSDKKIFLVTQKKAATDNVSKEDLFEIGAIARIVQLLRLPDGTIKVLIDVRSRAKLENFYDEADLFSADVSPIKDEFLQDANTSYEQLVKGLISKFKQFAKLEDRIPNDIVSNIVEITNPGKLADHITSSLPITISKKQEVLSEIDVTKRLKKVSEFLRLEHQILDAEQKIKHRIKSQVENSQREYYLNEQLKAIKKELGDNGNEDDEIKKFEEAIKKTKLSEEARTKVTAELKKLKSMNPLSSEAGIVRTYVEWVLNIPWNESKELKIDMQKAEEILDDRHYGLEKVKERILEYISVYKRTKKIKGPILCLVGPPGVGKTSLAKSIAESMGRDFVKMSLGGVRDEAEIRGHRKTYIGALPGKIIQLMKKAKSSNPLFLLDEIDKLSSDYRGDPASALLEVLDPEQNNTFHDHYLEIDYDLSDAMFVTTANSLNIPHALLDRMEIVRLSGYTEDEKLAITKQYLIPKQKENAGLEEKEWSISDSAIHDLIQKYTHEAGVRNLEREIARLTRKATRKLDSNKKLKTVKVTNANLPKFLGPYKYSHNEAEKENRIGVVTGLAYTEFGGDILSIEAVRIPGKGEISYTGKLGEVMQESMQAAFSFFRSRSWDFGVLPEEYQRYNIHLHVPEGATPKDGPSAGIAITTAIVSLLTQIPVDRQVAMTGEITLRGKVLPIGGLKEKLLAALRSGITRVIIPEKNVKDLEEIPQNVKSGLEIIPVSDFSEVVPIALAKRPKPLKWKPGKIAKPADTPATH